MAGCIGAQCSGLLLGADHDPIPNDSSKQNEHLYWSFQEIRQPEIPQVKNKHWVHNPIDAFILKQVEAQGLSPSPPADKITLLRRATIDLIGLPPTPEEVDQFLVDSTPKAFEKMVDRLLNSPHYGERWARHWLDLARYAESEGFKSDETRPNAWRYRDYVINAFNQDKPYDRFIREQIAGDELWPESPDARVATAFNRHYPDESNAQDLFERRQQILDDITNTVGATFLGLTYSCARCHDHKFDPIQQADYYRLQAFFANVGADDEILLWPDDQVRKHQKQITAWEEKTQLIRERMEELLEPERKKVLDQLFQVYPPGVLTAVTKPEAERTPIERLMYHKAKPYMNPTQETLAKRLKDEKKKKWEELQAEIEKFSHLWPGKIPIGTGIKDLTSQAPPTHVLAMGMHDAPMEEVKPGFLAIFDSRSAEVTPSELGASTGRRTALANWLTSPENPLTARVMANRIWHYHFGRGIVATPSDFGRMGERPTHPQLLDWLAKELINSGWSMKHLHRLIMTSSTYQQTSNLRENLSRLDPENRLWWRFSRQRLEAEAVRDSALFVSGLLNTQVGGPSVFPELPPGMVTYGGWEVSKEAAQRNRRSVYVFLRRNTRYPMLEVFDLPDTHESCGRRHVTTTPTQALTLMNGKLPLGWARGFAARILREGQAKQLKDQIDRAYRLAYSRYPKEAEKQTALSFFDRHRAILADRVAAGEKLELPMSVPGDTDLIHAATLVDFCHMLINSNEFVYRN